MIVLFRFLKEIIKEKRNHYKLLLFRAKWRCLNKNNRTVADSIFNINNVKVGIGTYGHLLIHSWGSDNEELKIGNFCSIARDVHFILGGGHNYKSISTFPFLTYYSKTCNNSIEAISKGPIIIDDDVWIGFGTLILSGVHIGKGSVIAAGSVISKDIPPYSVYIPGHPIRSRFDSNIVEKIIKIDFSNINPSNFAESGYSEVDVTNSNIDNILTKIIEK